MFLNEDVFYKETIETGEKYDFDIVEFRGIGSLGIKNFFRRGITLTMFNDHTKGKILFQPELGDFPLRPDKKLKKKYII